MNEYTEILSGSGPHDATATLSCDQRRKSRQRVDLDDGGQAAVIVQRGTFLRGGVRLRAADGNVLLVRAADESRAHVHPHRGYSRKSALRHRRR